MFDFTVCEQQNLANSLFDETPELEKYLNKIDTLTKGGPRPPQCNPWCNLIVYIQFMQFNAGNRLA